MQSGLTTLEEGAFRAILNTFSVANCGGKLDVTGEFHEQIRPRSKEVVRSYDISYSEGSEDSFKKQYRRRNALLVFCRFAD
jgi:hypothetical protein